MTRRNSGKPRNTWKYVRVALYRRLLRNSNKRLTRRGNKPKFVRCYFLRSASENMFIGRVAGRGRGKSCRAASWTRRASESVVAVRQFEKTGWSIERNCLLGAAVCGGFKKPRTPRSWQRHENRHAKNKAASSDCIKPLINCELSAFRGGALSLLIADIRNWWFATSLKSAKNIHYEYFGRRKIDILRIR